MTKSRTFVGQERIYPQGLILVRGYPLINTCRYKNDLIPSFPYLDASDIKDWFCFWYIGEMMLVCVWTLGTENWPFLLCQKPEKWFLSQEYFPCSRKYTMIKLGNPLWVINIYKKVDEGEKNCVTASFANESKNTFPDTSRMIFSDVLSSLALSGCYTSYQLWQQPPRGVMVKAMNCGIVVREFVLQSRYYVHFQANTLGKGMNPLILPPAMGK